MIDRSEQEIMENWPESENPVVSVCCTTYNHEKYIGEAIDGFLMQETNFPFEIIVRDDYSTDDTASIVGAYVDQYPNLIKPIYETQNMFSLGVKPMPEVYKHARGKYLAICEGDDYWTDVSKLQKQVDFLDRNLDYVIAYSAIEAFNSEGILQRNYGGATCDLQAIELQRCAPVSTMTVCFRNVLDQMPPEFSCTRIGDLFTLSLLGAYGKGRYMDNIEPVRYRVHEGGVFSEKSPRQRLRMWQITAGALYSYYDRIGEEQLAQYFFERNLKASLQLLGPYGLLNMLWKSVKRSITRK